MYTNFHNQEPRLSTPHEEVRKTFYLVDIGFVATAIRRIGALPIGGTIIHTESTTV